MGGREGHLSGPFHAFSDDFKLKETSEVAGLMENFTVWCERDALKASLALRYDSMTSQQKSQARHKRRSARWCLWL